ncbi:MAG: TetR/AcrR family transcriptional regulator [Nitrospirae bacterium]|nr:TetR/AcrR family transcriptional regulator [Nitrospirota bacterium]
MLKTSAIPNTRERLLGATMKLVSEKGYLGATTREIAREAGVSELTLFRNFGSKEKLFEGLLGQYTFLPRLRELRPRLDGLAYEEALMTIAKRFLLTLKEQKSFIKIMYSEANLYPDKVRKVYTATGDELRATLSGYFLSLQKKGALRKVSPDTSAGMFLGMLFAYFRNEELMRGRDITKKGKMDREVREIVDIFVHGTMKERK